MDSTYGGGDIYPPLSLLHLRDISAQVTWRNGNFFKATDLPPPVDQSAEAKCDILTTLCRERFKSFTVFHRRFETLLRRCRLLQTVERLFLLIFTRSMESNHTIFRFGNNKASGSS
jgi:hypothetical protein